MSFLGNIIPVVTTDFRDLRADRKAAPQTIDAGAPGDAELVHPDVLDTGTSWNGYRYWMAVTPYLDTDSQYENPCILASNDAYTWVVPDGLSNPIAAAPASGYYNDVDLHMASDGVTLRCVWRHRIALASPNRDSWLMSESTDGVTWSAPITLLTNLSTDEEVSASILRVDGVWRMYYVHTPTSSIRLRTTTVDALTSGWTTPVTVFNSVFANGNVPWHLDAIYADGTFWALVNAKVPAGAVRDLWLLKSTDGSTFTVGDTPLMAATSGTWDALLYRATLWPRWVGGNLNFGMYYGSNGGTSGWQVARADLYDAAARADARAELLEKVATGAFPALAADYFDRADAATLGPATTGQTWSAGFGVSGGAAYPLAAVNTTVTVEGFASDATARLKIVVPETEAFLVFRWVDADNYWRAGYVSGAFRLQCVTSGAFSYNTAFGPCAAGDVVEVVCLGSSIVARVNGVVRAAITNTSHQTATKYGMRAREVAVRLREFSVRA